MTIVLRCKVYKFQEFVRFCYATVKKIQQLYNIQEFIK